MKKLFTIMLAVAACGSSVAQAQAPSESMGGFGYKEVRRSPYIAPAVALATVAVVAIVAVAVQNSSHSGHGHSHN